LTAEPNPKDEAAQRILVLLIAPFGSIAQLKDSTYAVDSSCKLISKCKVPSAVASYVYFRRKFSNADIRVLGLLPESLMVELDNIPNSYNKAVENLSDRQLNNIKDGIDNIDADGNSMESCKELASGFINDLRLEVVPMGGTFNIPMAVEDSCKGGGNKESKGRLEIKASLYDSQAVAAYLISKMLIELNAINYNKVYIYVDVTNAPNQLQVMTVRAAEGAASALSFSTEVALGFSALDPYIKGGELSLNVVEQRPLPGIRLPAEKPTNLIKPRLQDDKIDKNIINELNKLKVSYMKSLLYSVGIAASINLGALFLAPYLINETDNLPMMLAEISVKKYFELTRMVSENGSVTIKRDIALQEAVETISYLSLTMGAVPSLDEKFCVSLERLKDIAENLRHRGHGIAVNTVQEFNSIKHAAKEYMVEGYNLAEGLCLWKLKNHKQSSLDNLETARNLVAHGGLLENAIIVKNEKNNEVNNLKACLSPSCAGIDKYEKLVDLLRESLYEASGLKK
jgi:CRISPR-associated protein Csx1